MAVFTYRFCDLDFSAFRVFPQKGEKREKKQYVFLSVGCRGVSREAGVLLGKFQGKSKSGHAVTLTTLLIRSQP